MSKEVVVAENHLFAALPECEFEVEVALAGLAGHHEDGGGELDERVEEGHEPHHQEDRHHPDLELLLLLTQVTQHIVESCEEYSFE